MKLFNTRFRRFVHCFWLVIIATAITSPGIVWGAAPLVTLQYKITGTALQVTPASLSVPKGVAGSVLVQLANADGSASITVASLADGAYIEATLRGPSFDARRLVGQPNAALSLPPLNLVGDYQLDNIRLVDSATGATRLEGNPSSVPVHVFDQVLVSQVTSRPLTLNEIQDKGIVIDQNNFRAVEFQVGFVLDGKTIPVAFPVIAPTFQQSTEIIPQAELQSKLAQAAALNQQISSTTVLPPELQTRALNIQVAAINFQQVDVQDQTLALQIPPIPALMVIPGNIGFLNQFFSVQIFTENGAPSGSGLSVFNVQAQLVLPTGPDQIAGTWDNPGDDPLRFARIGPNRIIQSVVPVVRPGPDGKVGTADDIPRLYPGESGQGEFLVEGLQEGLHVMNLNLTASLDGLAAGTVQITGKAAGSVLVRNPTFSMAFSHPRTTRTGEAYDAYVTLLNTSPLTVNLVNVTLAQASLSGGVLESPETVQLGNIAPGQTATAKYRVRAQRTGAISFSNLTTGSDAVTGRFRLTMGIDERGVALSPDSIGMPAYVDALPADLVYAANRVLGQALSVATAAQLPAGVNPVMKSVITSHVLEMAEAGQRLRYGDSLRRILSDLLLDWQGGRNFDAGFDQILRTTEAGRAFRDALFNQMELADSLDATARLADRGPDLAGLSQAWQLASVDNSQADLSWSDGTSTVTVDRSDVAGAAAYRGTNGLWLAARPQTNGVPAFTWRSTNGLPQMGLAVLLVSSNGTAQQLRWTVTNPPPAACYRFELTNQLGQLLVDNDCDGVADDILIATVTSVSEVPPQLLGVIQDRTVDAGRPNPSCLAPTFRNYGTILAALFSKPMGQNQVNVPAAYQLENGNTAGSVQIQPGARVALLNMRQPVGAIHPRTMTISGISDARGNPVLGNAQPIQTDLFEGAALRGRVARADGSPAAGIPVTLTMYDQSFDPVFGDCNNFEVRVSQIYSDTNGFFAFDFVVSDIPYSVSATDTGNLPPEAIQIILDSAAGDALARDRLLQLATSPSVQNTLLAAFAVNALPQAVAAAEGLDRALLRDQILGGSPREGTEVPVALRFRGRGTVAGQVLASDASTALPQVAVNLFPDPGSREQGRGLFSDSNGRFAFAGVPLGLFTVQAQSSSGQFRTIAGTLDQVGQVTNVTIVLSTNVVLLTGLQGQVLEPDNITPHPRAQVLIGHDNANGTVGGVVAAPVADANGFWSASGIPVGTYDVLALSFDGRRKGERQNVLAANGVTNHVAVTLQGVGRVIGRVENSVGAPVPNALVAGGEAIVRTDTNGLFTLTGVPLGQRGVSVGLERNPAAGIDFPRYGGASVNVLPGVDNFVVVRFTPSGRVVGRVLDALGLPVPNVQVAMPFQDGFMWVNADGSGNYKFENLQLGQKTVSAPSPAAVNTDTSHLVDQIQGGTEDEIIAAVGEAFNIFTGASDPYLNGSGATFNPGVWGFTTVNLSFDGQTAVADIHYLKQGTISGIVKNGQGVPIGARVRLTGVGPLPNGSPGFMIRGEANTDPALGTFIFANEALTGSWGLQAASPFYPAVITVNGQTTLIDPNATNIVLQFPPTREVNGRLAGYVFNPDGSPAGSNVNVKISFGDDYVIRTDTNGFFDTQIGLPALNPDLSAGKGYSLEATDPVTGFRGISSIGLQPGITNLVNIHLLGRGALTITVLQGSGQPAVGAQVSLGQGSYPNDHYQGVTDTNGIISFQNIFEGSYGIGATFVSGPTTVSGRTAVQVPRDQTATATVYLTPTANLAGTFLQRDLVTPVAFAQIAVGNLGFAATDSNGVFSVTGIPLGTYRLYGQDPLNGRAALLNVTLSTQGENRQVQLVEQSLGDISGQVVNSYNTGFVPGASVTLSLSDGITTPRTVTTGPDGSFDFPGTPAGAFSLYAQDPVTALRGINSATLPDNVASFRINVPLNPLATLAGIVYQPDGITPATNATVQLNGPSVQIITDTDQDGRVSFVDLRMGYYRVIAYSFVLSENRSFAVTNLILSQLGAAPDFALRLQGVGSVTGRVFQSSGTVPAPDAEVTLHTQSPLASDLVTTFADANGFYGFDNIAAGSYRLTVADQALGATYNGLIATNGQSDVVNLTLGASGVVTGHLVRADGTNPVPNIDVLLSFGSQSGLPGRAVDRTDDTGFFELDNIPVGAFNLEAIAADFSGIARLSSVLSSNGQTLDLGTVVLDEADPRVVNVSPADTSVGVLIATAVDLYFSEALDPASVNSTGVYLRSPSGSVPATLQLLPDPTNGVRRLARITPNAPLQSQVTYDVIVVSGVMLDAVGRTIATGPTDLVGRSTPAPFIARFTTADQEPPRLVSLFPSNNAVQIDPRAVMRLTFNEPIRDSNYTFTVTGPGGPVAGATAVGVNNLALVFTPTAALDVNVSYSLSVAGVQDLAGNLAANLPFTSTFATLDTIGPNIATLRIGDGRSPIGGATLPVEALLATNESGASVRFTQDFTPVGSAVSSPYRVNVTLPAPSALNPQPSTTIRAIAADRYNNDGPLAELTISVVSNQPPVVQLVRLSPATGPIGSSRTFTLQVSATDDLSVTNITVVGLGAIAVSTNFTSGATNVMSVTLPGSTLAGAPLEFQAQATDGLGVKSTAAVLDLDVVDATPPTVALLSPTNNTMLDPAQGLNVAIAASDNSTNYSLLLVLSGSVAATQTLAVATAPNTTLTNTFSFSLAGAPTNGVSFVATLTATDGNTNTSTLTRTYFLPDITPPSLVSLTPSNGAVKVSVLATVDAVFSEPVSSNSVNSGTFIVRDSGGQAVSGQYSLLNGSKTARFSPAAQLAFGLPYTVELNPGITDLSGNPFAGLSSGFTTFSNLPPVLTFARVSPATGPIGSGQTLSLSVGATSDLGITNLSVVASGAIASTNRYGDGATRTLTFTVPANTPPATPLQFQAQVNDAFGNQSSGVISYQVIDVLPPTLAIVSPAVGVVLDPAQTMTVVVTSSDNGGNHQLQVELSGAVIATQTVSVATAPNLTVTNLVSFSLASAPPDGSALQLTVRGIDTATNGAVATRSYHLIDTTGPQLVAITPTNGAPRQPLWLNVTYQFNEAIAFATLTTNTLLLTNNAGTPTPYTISQDSPAVARITPTALPLLPGVTYTNLLLPGLTDLFGNALTQTNGAPLPSDGLANTLTTATILSVTPTNGTAIDSGASMGVSVNFEPGLGADFFRFVLNGGAPFDVAVSAGSSNAVGSMTVPSFTISTNITLTMTAIKAGAAPYQLPPVVLRVSPVNHAPVANSQEVITDQFTPVAVTLTGSDVDGYPLNYSIVGAPGYGSLSGTVPNLTYTASPDLNSFGYMDSFTFRVTDAGGLASTGTVSIIVAEPFCSTYNHVENSSFEGGTDHWIPFGSTTITPVSNPAHDNDSAAVHVTGRTTSTGNGIYQQLLGTLQDSTTYVFSGWMYVESATSQDLLIQLRINDGAGAINYPLSSVTASQADGWVQVMGYKTVRFTGTPTDVRLIFNGPALGVNFYLDDVNVHCVTLPPDGNLLDNGGFELGTTSWDINGGYGTSATLLTTKGFAHGGSRAGYSVNRTATWQGPLHNLPTSLQPSSTYLLTAWAQVQSTAPQTLKATVQRQETGSSTTTFSALASLTGVTQSNGWVLLTATYMFTNTAALTTHAVYFEGPDIGTNFFVDDVRLVPWNGSPLAQESFDYLPAGALANQGNGPGFNGLWSGDGNFVVNTNSLVVPGLVSEGLSGYSGASTTSRTLTRALIAPLGAPGTTRYVSYVLRPESATGFYGLRLEGSTTNIFFGRPGGGAAGDYVIQNDGGTAQVDSGVPVVTGATVLLVLKCEFFAGNDRFTLYINPIPGLLEPATGTVKTNADAGTINAITLTCNAAASFDEMRIGATFGEVVPAPCAPLIVAQPASVVIANGLPATFSVVAASSSPLGYQWRKDGLNLYDGFELFGTHTATLTINPASSADEGVYDVVVLSACNVANSAPSTLTLKGQDGTWTNLAGGSWTNTANWLGGIVAGGLDARASFSTLNLTADATVMLDGPRTLGSLEFGDAGAPSNDWTLNPGAGGALILLAAGTPTIAVTNRTATLGVSLAGSQGFQKTGGGTLHLASANTYSGKTTIGQGVLSISADANLGASPAAPAPSQLTIDGGTLRVTGSFAQSANRGISIGSNGGAIEVADVNSLTNLQGITGAGALTKNGTGTLTLSGPNDCAGPLNIIAGTLAVGAGGTSGSLGTGQVNNNANLVFNRSDDFSITNVIAGSAAGTLTKNGAGVLTLAGANTFTCAVTVAQGTLKARNNSMLGTTNGPTTISAGATLDIGTNTINLGLEPIFVSGSGVGGNGAIINSSTNTAFVGPNVALVAMTDDTTFGGTGRWDLRASNVNNPALAALSTTGKPCKLTKVGAGGVFIVGVTVDPALGDVDVQAGVLSCEAATTGLGNPASNLTVQAGATLQLYNLTNWLNKRIVLNSTGTVGSSSGANTVIGPMTLNGSCVFNVSAGSLTLANLLAGSGSLTKSGSGLLTLGATNTFTGGTTNSAGTLLLANNAALGFGPLVFTAGSVQLADSVTITNQWVIPSATTDLMLDCPSGTGTWAGNVTASGGASFRPGTSGSGTLVFSGNASIGGLNFIVPRGNLVIGGNGVVSAAGGVCAIGRSSSGTGTTFTARDTANLTFSSGFMLGHTSSGTAYPIVCTLQNNASLSTATATLNLHNGASSGATTVLNLNGGTLSTGGFVKSQTGASQTATISFNGSLVRATTNNTAFLNVLPGLTASVSTNGLKLDDGGYAISIAQPLIHSPVLGATPDGGLAKSGSGTLTLAATNTYSGTTTVSNGTLLVTGSLGTNTMTVVGGTLGGNGAILGAVIVQAGGALSPGPSLATLTISNSLTLAGTSVFELNKTLATNDLVRGLTNVLYGGTLVASNLSGTLADGDSFKLFDAGAYSGAFASIVPAAPGAGLVWDSSSLTVDGRLKVLAQTGGSSQPFSISQILLSSGTSQSSVNSSAKVSSSSLPSSPGVSFTLRWSAAASQSFVVESSSDLAHWGREAAVVSETSPGLYEADLTRPAELSRFFRLRWVPKL